MLDVEIPAGVVEALRDCKALAVLTGAGVSAESGVPTFRDALDGLWARYDPSQLATAEAFERDPALVTRWYDERRLRVAECDPNLAHGALATLESIFRRRRRRFTLITQNVDGLHQRAGNRKVIELHGSLFLWRCTQCGEGRRETGGAFTTYPPTCDACGGVRRPAVVWFGENLPPRALEKALDAAASCELFFSLGTSSVVHPASGLIEIARRNGAASLEVNPEPTPITRLVDWSIPGRTGEVLPRLVEAAF